MSLKKLSYLSLEYYFTPRPHIKVEILGRTWFASLDTGSSLSFINKEVITHCTLHDNYPVPNEPFPLKLANGSLINIDKVYSLNVTSMGHIWKLRFHAMPNSDCPIIFGIDVISELNLSVPPTPWHLISQNDQQKFSIHVNPRGPVERRSIRIQTDASGEENQTGQKRKSEDTMVPAAPFLRKKKRKPNPPQKGDSFNIHSDIFF